jgi:hypothetical protein
MESHRIRHAALTSALAVVAALAACDRRPPEQARERPTTDGLAATANAIGVPYQSYVVIRHDGNFIALTMEAGSQLGDRVSYRWYLAEEERQFSQPDSLEHGGGEAVERPFTGRIALPDGLVLEWSRGSTAFGWLYWPQQPTEYAVFSRPYQGLSESAGGLRGGRWLTHDMFQR